MRFVLERRIVMKTLDYKVIKRYPYQKFREYDSFQAAIDAWKHRGEGRHVLKSRFTCSDTGLIKKSYYQYRVAIKN